MSYMNSVLMLPLVLLTAGCASLKVDVSVIDPNVIKEEADQALVEEVLPIVLAQSRMDVDRQIGAVMNEHFSLYVKLSSAYQEKAQALAQTDPEDSRTLNDLANWLQADFSVFQDIYASTIERVHAENESIRQLHISYEKAAGEQQQQLQDAIVRRLKRRAQILENLSKSVQEDIEGSQSEEGFRARIEAALAENVINTSQAAEYITDAGQIVADAKELFSGQGFIDSPYAYALVAADDEKWAEKFDYSHGRGVFGNTDVAIKALGPGNFTVKGLSFNPSDVAQAASTVTTQAVLLAAQIYGVPVNVKGTPQGDGAALAASSTQLAQARSTLGQTKANMLSFQDALQVIAEAITAERSQIEGAADDRRKEAINAIKAIYKAQKSRLAVEGDS